MSNVGTTRSSARAAVAAVVALLLTMFGITAVVLAPSASAAVGDLTWASCISNADLAGCTTSPVASMNGTLSVDVSPDGKNVYLASQNSGTVTMFKRNATTGAVTFDSCISNLALAGCTTAANSSLGGARTPIVSPDGKNVYIAAGAADAVTVFTRDTSTGALTYDSCISNAALGTCAVAPSASLDGPTDVRVSPDGKNVYLTSENSRAVTVLNRAAASGALTFADCFSNSALSGCTTLPNATLNKANWVAVSPDGKSVYVTGWATSNAVTTFDRNTTTGALSYVSCISNAALGTCVVATHASLSAPVGVVVSPDGKNVYVAGQDTNSAVTVFNRATNGALTYASCISNLALAGCTTAGNASLENSYGIVVSPDGRSVLVASWGSKAVTTLSRNTATGALTYSSCVSNGALGTCTVAPAATLVNPDGIAVSPDGANAYVASLNANALTVFARVVPAPTVSSVSPSSGPVTGGNTVTITGSG
ncbi:MAG: beta-propeller fold lactonase family protein, partial [Actinomycetes bacterium]